MKALFVADIHIKIGQKNVPSKWQKNRFRLLAQELNKADCDYVIIGGDLLDVAKPSLEEVGVLYDFLKDINKECILIPGNHEMLSKKVDCFINIETMLKDLNVRLVREFTTIDGIDYIPYNILFDKEWPSTNSELAVTHVRGEIPPHVKPEIPLETFSKYKKVFAGDLHSFKNTQRNIFYPGSPITTSFHRSIASGSNGYFLIDTSTGEHRWVELFLPCLVRQTISSPDEAVATDFHHTIYELEGDLEQLSKVKNTELLSKKVAKNIAAPATLDLQGSITEELQLYFKKIGRLKDDQVGKLLTIFEGLVNDKN